MKKLLVMLVAVGLMAGTANAATLWMQFEGGGTEVTLAPSDVVRVEIWIDLLAGDSLSGGGYPNWPDTPTEPLAYPSVEGLEQADLTTDRGGWSAGVFDGTLGDGIQQVAFGADSSAFALTGPGSFLLGYQWIHQNDITNADSTWFDGSVEYDFYPIMFGGEVGFNHDWLNATGGSYTFDPGYAGYSGYYTWGQGSSYISGKAVSGNYELLDSPLIVHCIPEPASLALLALGGLAIIRRR